jgi:sulfate adenylyltransferase subunit 1
MSAIEHLPSQDNGLLRFMTCGSVDDGKSTLIGRLLYDTKTILADALSAIEKTSRKRGLAAPDLALLTDGLQAEREQGITIDVAYRYFSTATRKYIIADAPGHEQYTRNMVTAASTTNLAVIMIDARKGVLAQTRRHSYIAHLVGVPHLVVAVNKMDLVDYDESVFERIRAEYLAFADKMGLSAKGFQVRFIPISALAGDNIVSRSEATPWYTGPSLLEILESAPPAGQHKDKAVSEAFRFPVQCVCRPQAADDPALHDYRGFMGRIESGSVKAGDAVTVLPSGRTSRIKAVHLGGAAIARGVSEQSVTLLLEDEIDISRGNMIVKTAETPEPRKALRTMLCWLSETPLSPARTYLIRHTTRTVKAKLASIAYKVDVNSQEHIDAAQLAMNDIAEVDWKLAQPVFADAYIENRATGAFIVIDEATNNTVGAGMVL